MKIIKRNNKTLGAAFKVLVVLLFVLTVCSNAQAGLRTAVRGDTVSGYVNSSNPVKWDIFKELNNNQVGADSISDPNFIIAGNSYYIPTEDDMNRIVAAVEGGKSIREAIAENAQSLADDGCPVESLPEGSLEEDNSSADNNQSDQQQNQQNDGNAQQGTQAQNADEIVLFDVPADGVRTRDGGSEGTVGTMGSDAIADLFDRSLGEATTPGRGDAGNMYKPDEVYCGNDPKVSEDWSLWNWLLGSWAN